MSQDKTIRILTAAALNRGLHVIESRWRDRGGKLDISHATAPKIFDMLRADAIAVDVVMAPVKTVTALCAEGKLSGDGTAPIGRVGAGVAVRSGLPRLPDVSTAEALTASLLAADAIIHNRASSGIYIAGMLAGLDIHDRIADKIVVVADADAVVARLREGKGLDLGFTGMTEIMNQQESGKVALAGPLPDSLQNYTEYWAARSPASKGDKRVDDFLAYLASPEGHAVFLASGVV